MGDINRATSTPDNITAGITSHLTNARYEIDRRIGGRKVASPYSRIHPLKRWLRGAVAGRINRTPDHPPEPTFQTNSQPSIK
jgi:hypothetical protein